MFRHSGIRHPGEENNVIPACFWPGSMLVTPLSVEVFNRFQPETCWNDGFFPGVTVFVVTMSHTGQAGNGRNLTTVYQVPAVDIVTGAG